MEEPEKDRGPEGAGAVVDDHRPPDDEPHPAVVPEADSFRLDRVDQEAAEGDEADGDALGHGLTLSFDDRGIEVTGPNDGDHRSIRWSDVEDVSFGTAVTGSEGATETPLDLTLTSGPVRYLVRSDGPVAVVMAALEIQVTRWTVPGRTDPPGRPVVVAPPPPPSSSPTTPLSDGLPYPPPTGPAGYPPPAPYGFDTSAPIPPYGPFGSTSPFDPSSPFDPYRANVPAGGRKRTRRTVTLVVALVLVASGVGLAVGLAASGTSHPPKGAAAGPALSPDEHLAQQLLLTRSDLPVGWQTSMNPGTAANSPALQQGEARITDSLARCMGITDAEGAIVLGGEAPDQTAQTSSPIFVAPTSGTAQTAVELQTAATVVRTHGDEQQDFALFANPKYPQCAATASAEELQLGVNQTSGAGDQAGPATVSTVQLPGASGLQQSALLMAFTVVDGSATIHVQVESISLGAHRLEAGLEVFAIGGQIPSQSLAASIATFERRVASGGASSVV